MSTILKAADLPGDWYRSMAATYRSIAEACKGDHPVTINRRVANFAEAAKYEGIATRLDGTS